MCLGSVEHRRPSGWAQSGGRRTGNSYAHFVRVFRMLGIVIIGSVWASWRTVGRGGYPTCVDHGNIGQLRYSRRWRSARTL